MDIAYKKIIAFQWIQCPRDVLAKWIKTRILDWNIDRKLVTIVEDNAKNSAPDDKSY